jgi:hypothetical protein
VMRVLRALAAVFALDRDDLNHGVTFIWTDTSIFYQASSRDWLRRLRLRPENAGLI